MQSGRIYQTFRLTIEAVRMKFPLSRLLNSSTISRTRKHLWGLYFADLSTSDENTLVLNKYEREARINSTSHPETTSSWNACRYYISMLQFNMRFIRMKEGYRCRSCQLYQCQSDWGPSEVLSKISKTSGWRSYRSVSLKCSIRMDTV
jgi:hypothetical protein